MPDKNETFMAAYREWMRVAPPEVKRELAELAGMTHNYLSYSFNKSYMPPASVRTAVQLEEAFAKVNANHPELNLPAVVRQDMASICFECPHARRDN